jgi:tail tube GTA-gp10-like protein
MSHDGSVTFTWADGEYRFRLGIGELRELQDKCGTGPEAIFERLVARTYLVDDVRETLRLGLIGGGMQALRAKGKVDKYADSGTLQVNAVAAYGVLAAALRGDPNDNLGKQVGEITALMAAADASGSQPSSEPPPQSGGVLNNSTAPAFGNLPPPSKDGMAVMAQKTNSPNQ